MRRLKLYILLFGAALTLPLAYLVLNTLQSLEREEQAEMRYFAETLFNDMEEDLALLVRREELRPIDAYSVSLLPGMDEEGRFLAAPFIVGYLQNNPDGSFLAVPPSQGNDESAAQVLGGPALAVLEEVNRRFNALRRDVPPHALGAAEEKGRAPPDFGPAGPSQRAGLSGEAPTAPGADSGVEGPPVHGGEEAPFSRSMGDKYFAERPQKQVRLGKSERRVERVTPEQVQSLAKALEAEQLEGLAMDNATRSTSASGREGLRIPDAGPSSMSTIPSPSEESMLQAEVDPMQSLCLTERWVYVFRRIVVQNRVYRQGFVLETRPFLEYLLQEYFTGQPMARFARLELFVRTGGETLVSEGAGEVEQDSGTRLQRSFARPFSFLQTTLRWDSVPRSEGRSRLAWVVVLLAVVVLVGLFAIYQSARMVLDLSERRTGFVSSVTHELKTPLTNIRLYVDMLEQGMASDPQRRERYFGILASETDRLSRLIQNVLEFSKLERRQRHLNLEAGDLGDVAAEAAELMEQTLEQAGFSLHLQTGEEAPAVFDREVMLQVLMNLMENSVKFGRQSPRREITLATRRQGRERSVLSVSDTGPGIERQALKRVFDDFYRADNSLTRSTQGTGIGLALVRRFVEAMGGEARARNNEGEGCTVEVLLPQPRRG